jgi:hypothetical protein
LDNPQNIVPEWNSAERELRDVMFSPSEPIGKFI